MIQPSFVIEETGPAYVALCVIDLSSAKNQQLSQSFINLVSSTIHAALHGANGEKNNESHDLGRPGSCGIAFDPQAGDSHGCR